MAGWIKIHRDIATHWIFQDECKFKWWIDLLLMASYEDNKQLVGDRLIEVKRGQMIVSLSFLSKRWGKAKGTILKFLELLESDHMIDRCTDRKVTILTICKYESYQEVEKQSLTDVVNDCLPMTDRSLTEVKKLEEVKEIYNTPTAHTHESEQDFINRYRAEGMWTDVALILHVKSISDCQHLFDRWIIEYQHNGDTHQSYQDFKKHFIQWARITIAKEKTQNNGNTNTQDRRRGVQVVANKVEDYQGSF